MSFYFENQGINTFLVYEIKPTDESDTMSLGMISNNKIDGFATTLFTQMDNTRYIKYDISAKLSVKQFFEGVVNRKRLIGVFRGIVNALIAAEDYMIDNKSIVLDTNFIFADVSTCKTSMICLPIVGMGNQYSDFGAFFKNIMFSTQLDSSENCDYVAKIINYLNSASVFSLYEFKKILDGIEYSTNTPATNVVQPVQQAIPQPVAAPPVQQTIVKPEPIPVQPKPAVSVPVQPQQAPPKPVQTNVQPPTFHQPVSQQPAGGNSGVNRMNNPGQNPVSAPVSPDEKPMSFFSLMMHYNKENAAKYKAQQAAKKNGQAAPQAPVQSFPQPGRQPMQQPVPGKNKKNPPAAFNGGFAVPGQQQKAPVQQGGFAIPGQGPAPIGTQAPAQRGGFAIPGQGPAPIGKPAPSPIPAPIQNKTAKPAPAPVQQTPFNAPVSQGYQPNRPMNEVAMNFGETTVLGGGEGGEGETTVLGDLPGTSAQQAVKRPFIVRVKNNERIAVDKPVFRIGKERSFVDYFVGDNAYVSRVHANVVQKDGRYFIIDNNSRNRTFVNGEAITSSTEVELHSGDTFKLANEEFEFKLF